MWRFINTLKYLQAKQILYRLWYKLKAIYYRPIPLNSYRISDIKTPTITWPAAPVQDKYKAQQNTFTLLNLKHTFGNEIDWEFKDKGTLWNFHLHYFNWLQDDELTTKDKLATLWSYHHYRSTHKHDLRPYPASLRIRNWIHFFTANYIEDKRLQACVCQDVQVVAAFTEYHIAANHLLENAISLYWAGLIFTEKKWLRKGKELLNQQLQEQILDDGAHYEVSPMYHIHLTMQLLQTLVLARTYQDKDMVATLTTYCAKMLGWIMAFAYPDGTYAQVGDSTILQTCSLPELIQYAKAVGISAAPIVLSESGYRKINVGEMVLLMKCNPLYPQHQPGHRHADDLSVYLWHQGKEILCDTGISTYEDVSRRSYERSTIAHNTATINDYNSSEVWGRFRMGRRGKASVIDSSTTIQAQYVSRYPIRYTHSRKICTDGLKIYFCDRVESDGTSEVVLRFHLSAHLALKILKPNQVGIENIVFDFQGIEHLEILKSQQSAGFNQTTEAPVIKVVIKGQEAVTHIYPYSC